MRAFSNKSGLNIFYEKIPFALVSVDKTIPFDSGLVKTISLPYIKPAVHNFLESHPICFA